MHRAPGSSSSQALNVASSLVVIAHLPSWTYPAGHGFTRRFLVSGPRVPTVMGTVTREGRDESAAERADRNFTELLQEVRVAQTGVQILFAFLLTMPFSARFTAIGAVDRAVYVVTLLAAAGASALLVAPVAYHRQVFRQHRKAELVDTASRFARTGLV